jgi:hypothetical protein
MTEQRLTAANITAARDDGYLQRIHNAVRWAPLWLKPGDTAELDVQPSAPTVGVYLCGVTVTTATGEVVKVGRRLVDELEGQVYRDLAHLPHTMVRSGEQQRSGHGTIVVPGTTPNKIGWWVTVDTAALRSHLIEIGHDDLDDDWGTPVRLGLSDADTITDLISEITAEHPEIISSRVGAEPAVDPLYNGDSGEDRYRLLIALPNSVRIVETSDDLTGLTRHEIPADDNDPGVTRMVAAITAVVCSANRMLDGFFDHFQLR